MRRRHSENRRVEKKSEKRGLKDHNTLTGGRLFLLVIFARAHHSGPEIGPVGIVTGELKPSLGVKKDASHCRFLSTSPTSDRLYGIQEIGAIIGGGGRTPPQSLIFGGREWLTLTATFLCG